MGASITGLTDLAAHLDSTAVPGTPFAVAIDGCGGAGKSTFAAALAEVWTGSVVVHTDDFASWDCPLDWWPRLRDEVLVPFADGHVVRFQKFNWDTRRLDEWQEFSGDRLIVEGVSASRSEFRPYLDFAIFIETPESDRLRRGLERDGAHMEPQWRQWMREEDAYCLRDRPSEHADLVLRGNDAFAFLRG